MTVKELKNILVNFEDKKEIVIRYYNNPDKTISKIGEYYNKVMFFIFDVKN